ncbi:MAG: 23S rRNA pseudouridine(955/2504/2580) synthase RluC [Gammaproteobacteria bacterium]|nr:MAG: 23S rRNA pseudouridine(955/2504/2580) synthase RluC [Gammaproteobacteria bacterium]
MTDLDIQHTNVQKLLIDGDQAGQRIDNFLLTYLKGVPKTRIYKMLRKGEVRVNGGRIKPPYRIKADDQIRIPPVHQRTREQGPSASLNDVKRLEQAIVYESDRLIVLNKPSGLAVHGGSGLSFGVIEAMRSLRSEQKYLELVHRIDRDTSGCLMIAKRRSTLRFLHQQLRERQVNKIYYALVAGSWPKELRTVDSPLEKSILKSGERISVVSAQGKPSLTRYKSLQTFSGCSLIEARPSTGRTHQIRVHCASSGHPICGDTKYNVDMEGPVNDRLYLHAQGIQFKEREEGEVLTVTAEVDENWSSTIKKLQS